MDIETLLDVACGRAPLPLAAPVEVRGLADSRAASGRTESIFDLPLLSGPCQPAPPTVIVTRMTDGPGWYGLMGPPPRPGGRPGFSIIRPALLVGEYPTPADAAWLRAEQGVTAVLCLQDDADLASKNVRLAVLENAYRTAGVGFHRIPVPDGHDLDLGARLGEISDLPPRLVAAGERVSPHCTAGFNGPPPAAIASLPAGEGLTLA